MKCALPITLPMMALAGCVTASGPISTPALTGTTTEVRTIVRRVCAETMTDNTRRAVLAELDTLDATGLIGRVDTIATELERFDKAARACRGN